MPAKRNRSLFKTAKKALMKKGRKFVVRKRKVVDRQDLVVFRPLRHGSPFPARYKTKFDIEFTGFIATGTASQILYNCNLNGVRLPVFGGLFANPSVVLATTNCTGYSVLANATMYQKVRTFASRCEIELFPEAVNDTLIVTITPTNTVGVPSTCAAALTQPYTKSLVFSPNRATGSGQGGKMLVSNSIDVAKFLGVTKRAVADDFSGNLQAGFGGNPASLYHWQVNIATMDGGATEGDITYRFKASYWVEMYSDVAAQMIST